MKLGFRTMSMLLALSVTIVFGLGSSHAHAGSPSSSTLETTCAVCAVVDAGGSLAADRCSAGNWQERVIAPPATADERPRAYAPPGIADPRGPPCHSDASHRG